MGRLLAILVPGYPQARNGDRARALLVGAAVLASIVLAATTGWLRSPAGLLSFLAAVAAIAVLSSLDGRRRRGPPVRLRAAEWAFLAGPLWIFVAALLVPAARERVLGLAAYRAAHDSMAPTLLGGDRFLVDLRARTPARGDLVVLASPEAPVALVKRVVALEGDTVEAGERGLEVNGKVAVAGRAAAYGPATVPRGRLFAVGDDLARSRDCRHFGPVEKGAIRGRVLYVFWSEAWGRIGTTPR